MRRWLLWVGASAGCTSCIPTTSGGAATLPTRALPWRGPAAARAGRLLVEDCLRQAAACGFRGLQFNAVVASNDGPERLYESLGFARIGMIPGGFRNKDDVYEDMYIYYHPTE